MQVVLGVLEHAALGPLRCVLKLTKAQYPSQAQQLAAKKFDKRATPAYEDAASAASEHMAMLHIGRHPNVILYHGLAANDTEVATVWGWAAGGDLHDLLK